MGKHARVSKDMRTPWLRFYQHRHNAETRGVDWQFTFEEWWKAWQDSGRWDQRGWGVHKYCMCRRGDVGPYAPWNIFIATNGENIRSANGPTKTLPIGVRQQSAAGYYVTKKIRGRVHYLGTFPTPEIAQAIYENFSV